MTDELDARLAGVGGDEHLLAALMVVARFHRSQDVEEFCPASFGDPCTDAERFEHRDIGDGAFVHAGVVVRRECATCTDEDNQPVEHPCAEYAAVVNALSR